MKQENNIHAAISTLVVSYLMKKFNLDTLYYGMIYGLIIQLIMVISNYDYNNLTFNWYYLGVLPISMIMSYIVYYVVNYIKKREDKEYITLTIYDEDKIKLFMKYIDHQKQYYDQSVDMNYGDLEIQTELLASRSQDRSSTLLSEDAKLKSLGYNKQYLFKDLYLNMEGNYTWFKTIKEISICSVVKQITVRYVVIKIMKNKEIDTSNYFQKIEDYFDTFEKKIDLKYIKILKDGDIYTYNHVVTFHSGVKESFEALEEKFLKPFFHQEKDRLWSLVKNTCLNPEFYSSKGQNARISLLLYGPGGMGKSSLVYRIARCFSRHIISLDLRIATKRNIYQILQNPILANFPNLSYKDIVYLYEEFDISIKELALREKSNNDKYFESLEKNELKVKVNDEFCIRDLLEIFQGPIPFESSIMIATTNKYDEIKETCPELFRPGRLTPVYFGYIDQSTLQDISIYFFNKKINGYLPDVLTISTSEIIDLAFEALNHVDAHEYFTNKLHKLL